MSLRITDINFNSFRSYQDLKLTDLSNLTIIVGKNAVGKTNIIEGVGLLTSLTSFRSASAYELIRNGSDFGKISIETTDGNRQLRIELMLEKNKRTYKLNGKSKRISDLKGLIPSVTFTPDDLELVKGSHGKRRRSLDILGSQLNKNYYQLTKDFEKVIRHKNKLLKDEASIDLVASIDELLIKVGAQLTAYRSAFFNRLIEKMSPLYSEITGSSEILTGRYYPSWVLEDSNEKDDKDEDSKSGSSDDLKSIRENGVDSVESNEIDQISKTSEPNNTGDPTKTSEPGKPNKVETSEVTREVALREIESALNNLRLSEIARKRTLIGPHRDHINLFIDGMDSSIYASQGQQRSIVLAWKLAEAQLIEEMTGQLPILLLDDVMSELDEVRRLALVRYLSDEIQTFITTANIDYFDPDILNRANIIRIGE